LLPDRSFRNAMRFPSGENCGLESSIVEEIESSGSGARARSYLPDVFVAKVFDIGEPVSSSRHGGQESTAVVRLR
jgi:hypothetical protein